MLTPILIIRNSSLLSLNHFKHYLGLLIAIVFMVFPSTLQAQELPVSDSSLLNTLDHEFIDIPNVFVHVSLIHAELELLRFEMGKPKFKQTELVVKDASSREIFFQALTLFRKANRLSFEHTRLRVAEPDIPKNRIKPSQVYAIVDTALKRIHLVKKKLGIIEHVKVMSVDKTKIPSDVFTTIVQANSRLNLLLDQQFSPSDVFQQVTLAVSITSRLLVQFPDAARTPPQAPQFERGKRPVDVYRRLMVCYKLIRQIAMHSGLKMLILEAGESQFETVTPSDVYDIASLIVSELAYLNEQLKEVQSPRKIYNPGRKLLSHVYQRAGILEKQLIDLLKWVEEKPDWLRK